MKLSLFSIDHSRSAAIIHIFMAALVVVAALAALMTAGLNATGSSNAVTAEQDQLGGFRNGIRVTEAASPPLIVARSSLRTHKPTQSESN